MSGAHGGSSAGLDQKADIAYVDAIVAGALRDRGNYDASGNTFPASGGSGAAGAIKQGDLWYISVAGTLGSVAVGVGDTVRALADTPGQTAGNWAVMENNLGYVPERSIDAASAKTTPVDADTMGLVDSAASNVLKKVTWANIKATLKTYFDTLYGAKWTTVASQSVGTGNDVVISGLPTGWSFSRRLCCPAPSSICDQRREYRFWLQRIPGDQHIHACRNYRDCYLLVEHRSLGRT
jgi:hypothetical protein